MRRLLLIRWRVGVILVIGMLAVLSVMVALFYAVRGVDQVAGLPQPRQLAAIVNLVENTPQSEMVDLFEALRSAHMTLHVVPGAQVYTDLDLLWPNDEPRLALYRAALDEREMAAYAVPRKMFDWGFFTPLKAAEFRVALKDGGVLIIASESMAMFTDRGIPVGLPLAFLGVLVAFFALLLLNREFRPVLRLAKAVEALDPADPQERLSDIRAGTAEVRLLIEAFNLQQERVATLLRARSALIGGIQHDVRTFASRLRLRIEKLTDPYERRQAETNISDLVSLMDGALLATRHDAGKLHFELIDVLDLVQSEVDDCIAAGARADLCVQPAAADAQILGDRVALRRIISNLTDNALRYGGAAHLCLDANDERITLVVDDEGSGIPEDQRQYLLQPFARQETSRSRQTGGAGLGLSIVLILVEGHNGSLSIDDAPTGGARLSVQFPRFRKTGTS